ncbi:MAG: cation-translocating P-type ATPase [Desulfuromonadaceae bacterium]|nr:cation-translocating P-type ATPase [Desulfuromonadaceae bacterium]MDD2846820.1 cation-translocating P-type ATPase [Desulfuromonadaceae bacterium]MDD4129202.1 cation-translocating P-type ATPase [Desulfuromonadaceae bacterium]
MQWHTGKPDEIMEQLESSPLGLTATEAQNRLRVQGPNELTEKAKKTMFMMFLDQFKDFMIMVLIAAAIIAGVIGEASDTISIIVIIVLNAVIGFIQEYRAEKAMELLKKMSAHTALVLRNGIHDEIPAVQLVSGDVVILEAGQIVPADMRLIDSSRLKVEEATLTGESVPSEKHPNPLPDEHLPVGDRKNMAYKGTIVSYGHGIGIVVATGMATELGKIASMLQNADEMKTPLQKRLASFGQKLALAVLAICAIVFVVGLLRGEPPLLMLLTAISLAVAAIPEALPAVVTISLALGAKKMVGQNALIRKLPAVETLGSVTYICSDKTGTLTLNKMTVEEVYTNGKQLKADEVMPNGTTELFTALALSNDAELDGSGAVIGDPTETALYAFAKLKGFDKVDVKQDFPRVAEIPFDSKRKCMTTFHKIPSGSHLAPGGEGAFVSFTKGAIDVLMGASLHVLTAEGLKTVDVEELQIANDRMSAAGLRVLGLSMRFWDAVPEELSPEKVEKDLTVLGMVGMLDPEREEAKEAVLLCKSAGIRPVMITGDHPLTATTIAGRLGILESGDDMVITGRELESLSLEAFEERVEHIRVYARVAPEQKLKIIKALQDRGHFVAMTGDGVNDAPALKQADIGVAMGITGTDVTKESADMILLDDNFATIVKAVKEGRRIFDNIRKFIKYTMTSNSGEIWTIFLAPFLGLPIPLLPIHILWINLVTDGLPGLALAMEPAEKGVMKRPPRNPKESIFSNGLGGHIIWVGLLMGGVSLATQAWSLKTGHSHWQTMVFTVLCLSQMGHVLAIRSETESLFSQGLFSNKPLAGAFILTFVLQMATVYVPQLNPIFKTEPLTLSELALTIVMSSVVFGAVEIEKIGKRKK